MKGYLKIGLLVFFCSFLTMTNTIAQYEQYYGSVGPGIAVTLYAQLSGTDQVNCNITIVSNGVSSWTQGGAGFCRATIGKSSGLYYWEADATESLGNLNSMGICLGSDVIPTSSGYVGATAHSWGWLSVGNGVYNNGGKLITDHSGTYDAGSRLCFALDMTHGFLYIGTVTAGVTTWCKNTSNVTGVPTSGATGTGAIASGLSGTYYPAFGDFSNSKGTAYFNPASWNGTAPSGYLPIS